MTVPGWVHGWRVAHGWTHSMACILFGYLWVRHMRVGWRMGVNVKSGVTVGLLLGLLIGTGTAIYYWGGGGWLIGVHVGLGLGMVGGLAGHGWMGWRWGRKNLK